MTLNTPFQIRNSRSYTIFTLKFSVFIISDCEFWIADYENRSDFVLYSAIRNPKSAISE